MKIYSSSDEPVNGSDFIHRNFGGQVVKATIIHNHLKCFFFSVYPPIHPPSIYNHPNWKVHLLLKNNLVVSQESVFLGRDISCDEQKIDFQGSHRNKKRITYKKEGDRFLTY